MKKLLLFLIIAALVNTSINAQYKINKTKYDYHTYSHQVGDPHSPWVAGVTNIFLPGLGQMLTGEVGRGFVFLGGCIGIIIASSIGYVSSTENDYVKGGARILTIGTFGLIAIET